MRHLLALFIGFTFIATTANATEVKEVVSPGGFKAWLVEEHALPLIAVKIAFTDAGNSYDPKGVEGRANMTAALMMEGAGDLDSRAFNEALEDDAIELNFGADDDAFRASLSSLSEHKEKAFSYLGLALSKPRFDESAMERVRSQTISILTQEELSPAYLLHREWDKTAFGNHPYGNPILGTKETVVKLSKVDLSNYTHRYITRENILIAVVGDITPEELGKMLDTHLGALPAHYDPDSKLSEVQLPTEAKQVLVENDIPQTMVMFGVNGVKRNDPDYYAAYIMNQVLGGGGSLTSKLGTEIREKRGLAYSVYSQLEPKMHAAIWGGGFSTRNEKVGSALEILRATLKDFSEHGPIDKELSDAKTYLTGSFVLGLDSNRDIAGYLLSMQMYHLGRDYLDKRNKLLEAVSKDDVKKMANKLSDPSHLLVVMVGKPSLDVKK